MNKIIPWAVGVSAAALLGVMGFTYSGSRRQAEGCGSKCGQVSRECPDQGGCREVECGGRAWRGGRGAQASEAAVRTGCPSAAASRKPCGDANCGVKACVCGEACACAEKCGCKDCSCKGKCATCPAGCDASCGCKKTGAAPKPCGGDKGCGAKEGFCSPACPGLDKCGCSR